MLTEHTLAVGDASLHYARGPSSGPPLLFLHGVLRCWQDFLPLIPSLAARWHVHALDFRGHGRSSKRPGGYRVVDYVEDASAFLRHGCDEPAVVFGHSLGAMVALAVAAGPEAERCKALILEDPPFETVGRNITATVFLSQFRGMQPLASSGRDVPDIARALAEVSLATPGTGRVIRLGDVRDSVSLRFMARCLTRVDPEVFVPLVAGQWLEGYDLDALLSRVRCPVLLLQGDMAAGGMLTDADAGRLESRLPDCTRIKLDGVGHLIHWSQIETTLRLVMAYLESLERDE
jgi:pimeloyl-ACP methyl ester carboxylesterase